MHTLDVVLLELCQDLSFDVHVNVEQVLVADVGMMIIPDFECVPVPSDEGDLLSLALMLEEDTVRRHVLRFKLSEDDDEELLELIRVPARARRLQVQLAGGLLQ